MVSMRVLGKLKCVFEVLEKVSKQPPEIEAFDPRIPPPVPTSVPYLGLATTPSGSFEIGSL